MQNVAEFHKVSLNQFAKDCIATGFFDNTISMETVEVIWDAVKLPQRATGGSAGYDFYLPLPFSMRSNSYVTIPTGIRVDLQPGWFLELVPRSGLAFKHGMRLVNNVAIIDADYFYAENEGHIMTGITCEKNLCLSQGERFIQGIIVPHGTARNDSVLNAERIGGLGSTGAV